jgi:tripartite ATP-independent transporter DctM subunit
MSITALSVLGVFLLLFLIFSKMPIGFAMAFIGFVGFSIQISPEAAGAMLSAELDNAFASYDYSVIILFVFMGQVAYHTEISKRLFNTAYKWMGQYPGGLPMATVGGCGLFAAICGSSAATAATMGAVAIPELKKHNYSNSISTGTVAAGGTLGILIPPSVVFIVYGILTEQSIVKLFAAGIIPGILLLSLFFATIYIIARIRPDLAPRGPKVSFQEKINSLGGLIEGFLLFVLVVGGLFAGWFSPTEAGGIGAGGIVIISFCRRQLTMDRFVAALWDTTKTSAMLLIILSGAMVMGKFFTITQIPMNLANWVTGLPLSKHSILFAILFIYFLCGCFTEVFSVMIITIPIFFPVIDSLGFDPIWFGVVMTIIIEMGAITPPVGINTFVVKGLVPDVPVTDIFKGIIPFLFAMIICLAVIIIFPELTLWLPKMV